MTFDPTFNFTTKQQYLLWRLRWKQHYFYLVGLVREAKISVKDVMRSYEKRDASIGDVWAALRQQTKARAAVTEHLSILWKAKAEAGRQVVSRQENVT